MFRLSEIILNKRKTICFSLFVLIAAGAAVIFAAIAAERAGMYWMGLDSDFTAEKPEDNRGFIMADVSAILPLEGSPAEASEETEVVPLGIGPLPSVPSLTTEELKLYGVLSRGDGLISSADKTTLDEDIHWQEVVLEEGDTIESIAKEFGIPASDIRRANALNPSEKLHYSEVLYVPDSPEYVPQTLSYVMKLQRAEIAMRKQVKPISITAYVVKNGDTLWSISNRFNLDLDTIIGSNKLKDINSLKLGTTLRIPNQDGIFVRVSRNDSVAKLADRYGSSKEAVLVANSIVGDAGLIIGQEIFLPGAKIVAVAESGGKKIARYATSRITSSASRRFRWPVIGNISSSFGWRRNPFGRRRLFHSGLDIRAPRGRGIMAACDGRVVYAGWMSGYGKAVVISHPGGLTTLYGHCSSLVVGSGAFVRAGQTIARVGSTGRSTGNHLHFEVRRNGSPVNPIRFLK
ncbi:MAG: peptidoglycan DD-metalloendopeptidase family protein [Synergistaceae bacterium]|nr:peptidoglycan DD-metalloendopeptidase family protein [Synergistaceae bacterium]